MRRSRIVFLLLTVSLVAQACVADFETAEIEGCEDLSVGDLADLKVVGFSGYSRSVDGSNMEWTQSGPGTLQPYSSNYTEAQYAATEPGSVIIDWEYIRVTGFTYQTRHRPAFIIATSSLISTARCALEVGDASAPGEGTGFDVEAVVSVSTVEGLLPIGMESGAIWRFVFDCPDGRCDAEVRDGGPFGGMAPFVATYQADVENFVFDFVLDTPANEECGDDRWVGEITPLGWDEQGPVGFTFTMVNVLTCDSEIVVEWEGEGTRA